MKSTADSSRVWTYVWPVAIALATHGVPVQAQSATADTAAVASTVRAFHDALARADAATALRLLAPDAVILENGSRETREEYGAHHLQADIQFAQEVPAHRTGIRVTVTGDAAWVISTSTMRGSLRGKPVNSTGTELVVLTRAEAGWVIRAVHWSSRTAASVAR